MTLIYATTLARVKTMLGIPTTVSTYNAALTNVIAAVSSEFEKYLNRPLSQEARTEDYTLTLNGRSIWLLATPVVTVTSIKVDAGWSFSVSALDSTRYKVNEDTGRVYFLDNLVGGLGVSDLDPEAVDALRVVYTGGIASATASLLTVAPDIALAADIQVAEDWRRRDNPNTQKRGGPGGGTTWTEAHRLLPRVMDLLQPHRRMVQDL